MGSWCRKWRKAIESNATADEWAFTLKKGIEFHNGKTLDADDVIASIDIHRGEDSKSNAKSAVKPIEEIRKDGPNRVIFKLTGRQRGLSGPDEYLFFARSDAIERRQA